MRLKVILEPSDEGGYTVYVPALPGCISEGDSRDEALQNIREAIDVSFDESEPKPALIHLQHVPKTYSPMSRGRKWYFLIIVPMN